MNEMEWENMEEQPQVYVKVMSEEQMEILRKQISVYATICEQLVEMHKAITCHEEIAGVRMGNNAYGYGFDPLMASCGHKITARQRWTPTPLQLQILERIFEEGNGTPTKNKIKDITFQLSRHGPISETNVYNWFQNRRARSKRKQLTPNTATTTTTTNVAVESQEEHKSTTPQAQAQDIQVQSLHHHRLHNSPPQSPKHMYIHSPPDLGNQSSLTSSIFIQKF